MPLKAILLVLLCLSLALPVWAADAPATDGQQAAGSATEQGKQDKGKKSKKKAGNGAEEEPECD